MSSLKVGFSRVNITPKLGIAISGYFVTRNAKGVLDELAANCIAFEQGGKKALMYSCDLIGINQEYIEEFRNTIMSDRADGNNRNPQFSGHPLNIYTTAITRQFIHHI